MDISDINKINKTPIANIARLNNILKADIGKFNKYPMGSTPVIPPPPASWNSYYNNTCWETSLGESTYWDSTSNIWISGPNYLQIDVIGAWANGFRPTQIRITSPSPIEQLILYDSTKWIPFIVTHNVYPGSTVVTENITYYGNDIGMLFVSVEGGGQFQLTNIEFYG